MATVARVIELYGEAYWPILERLEAELEDRRARSARLNRHLKRFNNRKLLELNYGEMSTSSSSQQNSTA